MKYLYRNPQNLFSLYCRSVTVLRVGRDRCPISSFRREGNRQNKADPELSISCNYVCFQDRLFVVERQEQFSLFLSYPLSSVPKLCCTQ